MKITVVRSGGFAGLTRRWVVIVDQQPDRDAWIGLVRDLPWDLPHHTPPRPDRFVYRIRVSRRQVTMPEQELSGPWRELVDRVKARADDAGPGSAGQPSGAPDEPAR